MSRLYSSSKTISAPLSRWSSWEHLPHWAEGPSGSHRPSQIMCPPAERTFQLHLNHQKTLNTKIAPSARRALCCSSLSKQLYKLRSKKVGWGKALFKTARAMYEKLPKHCLPRWSPRCSPPACTMHRKTMMEQVQAEEQKKKSIKNFQCKCRIKLLLMAHYQLFFSLKFWTGMKNGSPNCVFVLGKCLPGRDC